jgi:hypothetical protein
MQKKQKKEGLLSKEHRKKCFSNAAAKLPFRGRRAMVMMVFFAGGGRSKLGKVECVPVPGVGGGRVRRWFSGP